MLRISRLVLTLSTTIVVLAFLTSAASALRSLSVSPGGTMEATSEGLVTFEDGEFFRLLRIQCALTLNGTLATSAAKRTGEHIGETTSGRTGTEARTCRESLGGVPSIIILFPIELTYNSILGTLPAITGILFKARSKFLIESAGGEFRCLYEGLTGLLAALVGGRISRIRFLGEPINLLIDLNRGTGNACPGRGGLRGSMNVNSAQTVTLV